MNHPPVNRLTGFVMLVGNGAVGKTSVSRVLDSLTRGGQSNETILKEVRKTNNLEYEYVTTNQTYGKTEYKVSLQFLIPPGQKESEGDKSGRSFERVIDIYKPTIHRLDVVLFTYDLANRDTFHDLVYWVDGVGQLLNDATHFILLGTHLDRVDELKVTNQDIETGLQYLQQEMQQMRPTWRGNCAHLEVSNLTGENLELLLFYLAGSVISSRRMIP